MRRIGYFRTLFVALMALLTGAVITLNHQAQADSTVPVLTSPVILNPTIVGGSITSLSTAMGSDSLDPTIEQVAKVTLTAANIIAMNGAPVLILAAPGTTKTIVPLQVSFAMTTTSTQFTSGGAISFVYHGASTNLFSTTIAAAVVNAASGSSLTSLGDVNQTNTSNTGIDITNATGAFATGTGTAIVYIKYRVLPF